MQLFRVHLHSMKFIVPAFLANNLPVTDQYAIATIGDHSLVTPQTNGKSLLTQESSKALFDCQRIAAICKLFLKHFIRRPSNRFPGGRLTFSHCLHSCCELLTEKLRNFPREPLLAYRPTSSRELPHEPSKSCIKKVLSKQQYQNSFLR